MIPRILEKGTEAYCSVCEQNFKGWKKDMIHEHLKEHAREAESEELEEPDVVNHPSHYTNHPSRVECIQITEHMNFCLGNAMKYLWRADLKNGIEDLRKAKWYVEREIERRQRYE